jgi:hypothetical protein
MPESATAAPHEAGILEVKVPLDERLPSGKLPLVLTVGTASSQPVDLFVQ